MSHARIEEDLPNHPKWGPLSDAAFRLAIRSICWCRKPERQHRHPGFVPARMLMVLAGRRTAGQAARLAEELVSAGAPLYDKGIWEPVDGGWLIHDFDQYGPPTIQQQRPVMPSKSEAGRLGGIKSAEARRANSGTAQPRSNLEASLGASEAEPEAKGSAPRSRLEAPSEADSKQTQDQPVRSSGDLFDLSGSGDPDPDPNIRPPVVPHRASAEAASKLPVRCTAEERAVAIDVFAGWKLETGHPGAVLDRGRARRIIARFREGFTTERQLAAIRNRRNDPFLMGQNDTGRVYDGLETLLRDAAQVERLELLTAPAKSGGRLPPAKPEDAEARKAKAAEVEARARGAVA